MNIALCRRCGSRVPPNRTRCPKCKAWQIGNPSSFEDRTVLLSEVKKTSKVRRISTGSWDNCLGGGLVTTSVVLLGGKAGAGKSTLSLQITDGLAASCEKEVLYICTEQDVEEIEMMASRLNLANGNRIRLLSTISNSEALEYLDAIVARHAPCALVLDSLPGLTDDPIAAVDVAKALKRYAVRLQAPVIIIDHITKEEDFAGLEKLQHTVDVTLSFYINPDGSRTLLTLKNRFGVAYVTVEMAMTATGLVCKRDWQRQHGTSKEVDWESFLADCRRSELDNTDKV